MSAPAADELVEDPIFNYRLRFHPRKGETLSLDVYVDPGGGVSIAHYHPSIEERFTVERGEATFTADGEEIVARAGDPAVVVRPGVRHTFRNSGQVEAHIVCQAEPALELQGFLTDAAAMARAGKYTKRGVPKPGALLEAIEWLDRYRDTVVITGGALPPPRLQPALLRPLARLQRRRQGKRGSEGGASVAR